MNLKVERGCHVWVELVREMGLEFYAPGKKKIQQSRTLHKGQTNKPSSDSAGAT